MKKTGNHSKQYSQKEKQEYVKKITTEEQNKNFEEENGSEDELGPIKYKSGSDEYQEVKSPNDIKEQIKIDFNFLIDRESLQKLTQLSDNQLKQIADEWLKNGIPYKKDGNGNITQRLKLDSKLTRKNSSIYQTVKFLGWLSLLSEAFFDYFFYLVGKVGVQAIFENIFHFNPGREVIAIIAAIGAAGDFVANVTLVTPGKDARKLRGLTKPSDLLQEIEGMMKDVDGLYINAIGERKTYLKIFKKVLDKIAKEEKSEIWNKNIIEEKKNSNSESNLQKILGKISFALFSVLYLIPAFWAGASSDWLAMDGMNIDGINIGEWLKENPTVNMPSGQALIVLGVTYYMLMQGQDTFDGAKQFFTNLKNTALGKLFKAHKGIFGLVVFEFLQAIGMRSFLFGMTGYLLAASGVISSNLSSYKMWFAAIFGILGGSQTLFSRLEQLAQPYLTPLQKRASGGSSDPIETTPLKEDTDIRYYNSRTIETTSRNDEIDIRTFIDLIKYWKNIPGSKKRGHITHRENLPLALLQGTCIGLLTHALLRLSQLNQMPYITIPLSIIAGGLVTVSYSTVSTIHQLNKGQSKQERPPVEEEGVNKWSTTFTTGANVCSHWARLCATVASFVIILTPFIGKEAATLFGFWLGLKYAFADLPYFQAKMKPRIQEIGKGMYAGAKKLLCCPGEDETAIPEFN